MLRPETAQDVLDLVRQSSLVGEQALALFLKQNCQTQTRDELVTTLIAEGLLTHYQAVELVAGQWRGLRLGGYRVLDRLGQGGMSQVYLAEHAVLGKRVAVKVLSANLRDDKSARRRFVREARAASAIEHPNIVHVFDVDMDHDPPYLVMEYIEGISLQAAVSGHGTFSGGEAAAVGVQIASGLSVAAKVGLIHRDIKPANLLLDRRGGLKILDLGIVRLLGDDTNPPGNQVDEILGTLDYLAPEQAENSSSVDARADLYSLGATLYFLLAGHPPFVEADLGQKLAAKKFSDPLPINRLRPDVEADLGSLIQKLLSRDPMSRYQTADEVAHHLATFVALTADFPARLFRRVKPTTVIDALVEERNLFAAAPTQSLRKRAFANLVSPDPPSVSKSQAETDEVGPPTIRLSKAQTDMSVVALLEQAPDRPTNQFLKGDKGLCRSRTMVARVLAALCLLASFMGLILLCRR